MPKICDELPRDVDVEHRPRRPRRREVHDRGRPEVEAERIGGFAEAAHAPADDDLAVDGEGRSRSDRLTTAVPDHVGRAEADRRDLAAARHLVRRRSREGRARGRCQRQRRHDGLQENFLFAMLVMAVGLPSGVVEAAFGLGIWQEAPALSNATWLACALQSRARPFLAGSGGCGCPDGSPTGSAGTTKGAVTPGVPRVRPRKRACPPGAFLAPRPGARPAPRRRKGCSARRAAAALRKPVGPTARQEAPRAARTSAGSRASALPRKVSPAGPPDARSAAAPTAATALPPTGTTPR